MTVSPGVSSGTRIARVSGDIYGCSPGRRSFAGTQHGRRSSRFVRLGVARSGACEGARGVFQHGRGR